MTGSAFPIVIVGHVDHGKSTLIGRLLHDTGSLPEGKAEELQRVSARRGTAIEWSYALDALQLERDQAITVDSSQIWFRTPSRGYVIVDAPGHQEFLRNMITGAAQAEAAVIVVDAEQGITAQTRRHAYLVRLLGIGRAVLAVNKMDRVGFAKTAFQSLVHDMGEYGQALGLEIAAAVPIAARHGDNLAKPSENMPWYSGPTLLASLDRLPRTSAPVDGPFRMAVQDVYRRDDERIIVGRIDSGRLKVGDTVTFWPTTRAAKVRAFKTWNVPTETVSAAASQSVAFTLDQDLFVERGHVAADPAHAPRRETRIRARVFWLGREPLQVGRKLTISLGTAAHRVTVAKIHHVLDVETLATVAAPEIAVNGIAEVTLASELPIVHETHDEGAALGRAVLVDGFDVVGGCIVVPSEVDESAATRPVDIEERAKRNRHRGAVLWLTGLSGAGKSTLSAALQRALFDRGAQVFVLDGDYVRAGLTADLGFTDADRTENIRRSAEAAKLMMEAGFIVIAAFISPLASQRDLARKIIGKDFHEIFVDAGLDVCEQRDVKGLYKKARAGQIPEFTGISGAWEPPSRPELTLKTGQESQSDSLRRLLDYAVDATTLEQVAA